ncbi:sugar ABC transporter substrate-binding protein [Frankia sp. Cr1]|uniref:sugar ABC transporter substrate-binding protein n=1 Tax=Frankia sp. Cr1 TaxID=3073931 RepID=UPI002AD44069|nr:extracellular solute-binding protein [Frankia sp. Cr1]
MRKRTTVSAVLAAASLALVACGGSSGTSQAAGTASTCNGKIDGKRTLSAWFHTGQGDERTAFEQAVNAFNAKQSDVVVKPTFIPEGNYNEQVKAAAASGSLPDILDFDGPNLYNYAWNGNLQPLDTCVSQQLRADLLPTIIKQGIYNTKLYGVGTAESGLGLYVRKSAFVKAGVRIPTSTADAWTAAEFTDALAKLRAAGFAKPLDLQINQDQGEWYAYGFAPIIESAGADVISRANFDKAEGVINSSASVAALTVMQSWFKNEYVDANTDDAAFTAGRAAVSWVGHWKYAGYSKKWGDDLAIVPLPNFGTGVRTGEGSWQWGITKHAEDADAAWAFISSLFEETYQKQVAANGAIPASKPVLNTIPQFAAGGPERLYVDQLDSGAALPRPATPAYPTISLAFNKVIAAVRSGGNVQTALDQAAKSIDQDIKDNDGYPPKS